MTSAIPVRCSTNRAIKPCWKQVKSEFNSYPLYEESEMMYTWYKSYMICTSFHKYNSWFFSYQWFMVHCGSKAMFTHVCRKADSGTLPPSQFYRAYMYMWKRNVSRLMRRCPSHLTLKGLKRKCTLCMIWLVLSRRVNLLETVYMRKCWLTP